MIIHIPKISEAGSVYDGELPRSLLDLEDDRFIRPQGDIKYHLRAEIVSDQVIVQGWLETGLDLLCVACADFFSTKVRISSFLRACTICPGLETIDLSDDIREEILLAVPYYPRGERDENDRCKECGRAASELRMTPPPEPSTGVWDSLNGLKL